MLRRTETRLLLIYVASLALLPWFLADASKLHLAVITVLTGLTTLSLGFTSGGSGLIPLGQGAFYGAGAYAAAVLTTAAGFPAWTGPLWGALMGALLGLITGLSIRLRDVYFSMATLAIAVVVHLVALNWVPVTRGPMGILSIPRAFDLSDPAFFYLCLAVLLTSYWACARLTGHRFGRALQAIENSEAAAVAVGIDLVRYKLQVIVLGGAMAGVGGALFAQFMGFLSPHVLEPMNSLLLLVMTVVGGLKSLPGAILGAVLVSVVSESLQTTGAANMLLYGIAIVICMVYMPSGLAGLAGARRQKRRALRRA